MTWPSVDIARTRSEAGAPKDSAGVAVREEGPAVRMVRRPGEGAALVRGKGRGREQRDEIRARDERVGEGAREEREERAEPARPRRGSSKCTAMHWQGRALCPVPHSGAATARSSAVPLSVRRAVTVVAQSRASTRAGKLVSGLLRE